MSEKFHQIAPTFADACQAQQRLIDKIHRTPVISNQTINERVGCQVFFKCENLQKTGSFKVRGAINALSQLTGEQLARGVVTHSSGNHAAALAYAAGLFGSQAHIVMPENSSATKKAAVEHYGGRVVLCQPNLEARESLAAEVQDQTGGVLIPPFDHPHVIAGQATCTLELLQQQPDLQGVICPIGGGGLISGCCLAVRGLSDSMRIIGAEPAGADDAFRSKQANRWIPQTDPQTIADGLRTSLGELTWPFVRDQVDEIVCVSDQEIADAGRYFMQRSKLMIEPSSAVGVAVLFQLATKGFESLRQQFPDFSGNDPLKIGVILCGGNLEWN
jgi:threonine dehydratase